MLEDLPCPPQERCLTVEGLPNEVQPFFHALLAEWGFEVHTRSDELIIAKPAHWRASSSKPCEKMFLRPPIALADLWACVESQFHTTPRRHIRLKKELTAELTINGSRHRCRFISLSDAGGRLFFFHELLRGETGTIRFQLGPYGFETPCEIIYSLPKRSNRVSPEGDIGIVFHWKDRQSPRDIETYIVQHYLEKVRCSLNDDDYRVGLAFVCGEREEDGRRKAASVSLPYGVGL